MAKGKISKKKTTRKTKSSTKKASPRKKKAPTQSGISLDRKLDIVGVVLGLTGLLTLFALLSGSRGFLIGYWVGMLSSWFGWGVNIFALTLLALGLWLILRDFERIPKLSIERLIGLGLLLLNLLVLLHLMISPVDREIAYNLAAEGKGGGRIGAGLMVFLENGLGFWGMSIALSGWLVIALALAFDVSVLDLFRWVRPVVLRFQDVWDERRAAWRERKAQPPPTPMQTNIVPANQPAVVSTEPKSSYSQRPVTDKLPEPPANFETPEQDWELPKVEEMLDEGARVSYSEDHDRQRGRVIEETLASFGAPVRVVEINRGPTITQFGVEPDYIESRSGRTRVRVSKIAALADDLSLALAASRIRIEAPVPGKGYVGIEVPNEKIAVVALRDVIESPAFTRMQSPLRFALGQDVAGNAVAADLAGMPHLLIAGATGSGKSVAVNSVISGLILHNTPETLRFIMMDPKRVELTGYNGIPHLMAPVVVELDRVVGVLQWMTREMDNRYHKFAKIGARNIADYNLRVSENGQQHMPFLVVVIDELADLMMVAPDQTERLITRMAQLARATGIHLVISTQRPSVDVVTGLIKANIPARIAFAVASGTDSRVILDQPGAERLLGRGDMLFQAPDAPAPVRLQGVFVSDNEILRIVQYWRKFAGTTSTAPIAISTRPRGAIPTDVPFKQMPIWEEMEEEEEKDKLYDEAVDLVRRQGRASISMLQRRMRIGYTRSARLIDVLEEKGIIGPAKKGAQAREILDYGPAGPPVDD
ncbi:MAG: DNA translocase FtsK [Chloroflexi bacterium]|nr:DNA translocase FtsK [Chloroflexota bacterium]